MEMAKADIRSRLAPVTSWPGREPEACRRPRFGALPQCPFAL